jgi:hypothetical protein
MLSIFQAIKLMRQLASAIRSRDAGQVFALVRQLFEAVGLSDEYAEIKSVYDAFESGDWGRIIVAMQELLSFLQRYFNSTHLTTFAAGTNVTPELAADHLDAEADHWSAHCHPQSKVSAQVAETPEAMSAISVQTILKIVELVLSVFRLWSQQSPLPNQNGGNINATQERQQSESSQSQRQERDAGG